MKYDIIIIGGGISGLYNYYHLINTNNKVILFEKNDYFGGRILNQSVVNINHPTGAARFNLNHKLVIKLLKEFHLLDFRKDHPISASMQFIDCKDKFSNHNLKNGFILIKKVIKHSKKLKLNLKLYTFKEIAAMILTKKELDYMLVASGYSGQLKHMNAYDAMHLFSNGIRDDILYYNGKYDLLINKIVDYLKCNHANLKLNTKIEIAIKQTNYRIIIKTLIYRVIGILVSFSVCYFFFKNRTLAIKLSIFIEIIQTLVYYIYEYIWNEITWGVKS